MSDQQKNDLMTLACDIPVQATERLESALMPGLCILPGTQGKALVREVERDGVVSMRMFVRFPGLPVDFSLPFPDRRIRRLDLEGTNGRQAVLIDKRAEYRAAV